MNLTLFRIEPFDTENTRTIYALAPTVQIALDMTKHELPNPRAITALANNAWHGDNFARFIAWPEPESVGL